MLKLIIPEGEFYDEALDKFISSGSCMLELEHSLFSMSKWEAFFHKPFLGRSQKTTDEILWYIKAMTLTETNDSTFDRLTSENMNAINDYINNPMTATTFSSEENRKATREIITTELIYYWMCALSIPFETQYWHINRLLTLIKIANLKNSPQKKLSKAEIAQRNRALNRQRLNDGIYR